jgi:hypothetical protein
MDRKNIIEKIISLLDKHIMVILSKNEVDEDKLDSLTTTRIEYVQELNGIIRGQNTNDMFDKKYWNSYRKSS